MTDNEIKKGLECLEAEMAVDCEKLGCPMLQKGGCAYVVHSDIDSDTDVVLEGLTTDALDLINRQKAEIERLCVELDEVIIAKDLLFDEAEALIKKAKADAVKECFEKVRERLAVHSFTSNSTEYTDGQLDCMLWVDSEIYELEKELVGEGV